jgi:hypothetical protein
MSGQVRSIKREALLRYEKAFKAHALKQITGRQLATVREETLKVEGVKSCNIRDIEGRIRDSIIANRR